MSKTIIEVETKTFLRFWLVLLGIGLIIFFLYKALTGLILVGVSVFIALALRPLVSRLNTFLSNHLGMDKNHKSVSAVLAYSIIVIFFSTIIIIVGPVFIDETAKFIRQLPATFEQSLGGWNGINNFGESIGISNLKEEISKALANFSGVIFGNLPTTVVASIGTIGDIIVKGLLILVLTLLFLLEGPSIVNAFWRRLGARKEDAESVVIGQRVFTRMCNVISTYVSRQTIVAILDGAAVMVLIFVISLIFKLPTNLFIPMGLLAFLLYLIPMFGQLINACIIFILLAFSNPIAALTFLIIYIIYAQIENNFIAPKIQGDALKLPIVIVLSSMVIGIYMFGILGAIIAVPIAGCIRILIEEYPNLKTIRD